MIAILHRDGLGNGGSGDKESRPCGAAFFQLFLNFLEDLTLARYRVIFEKLKLAVYLFLVLASENGMSRR
jgi:hypothetical protein